MGRVLEELKRQAAAAEKNSESPPTWRRELEQLSGSSLLAALWRIHDYLDELLESLWVLQPEHGRPYPIPGVGELTGLRQRSHQLSSEHRAETAAVMLSFELEGQTPGELGGADAEAQAERLRAAGLRVQSQEAAAGQSRFLVQPLVPVSISFQVQPQSGRLSLAAHNLEGPGVEEYDVRAEQVDEDLLDELAKHLLGRESRFRQLLAEEPAKARRRREAESELPKTQEMDVSRLKSLFNREVKLYITYQNVIKELSSRSADFVIGRGEQCDLVVGSDIASRSHARLVFRKGKFVLIDQSTNGTFVKSQGGKEVFLQGEELPLVGSGFIGLGKSNSVDNEHLIYFSYQ